MASKYTNNLRQLSITIQWYDKHSHHSSHHEWTEVDSGPWPVQFRWDTARAHSSMTVNHKLAAINCSDSCRTWRPRKCWSEPRGSTVRWCPADEDTAALPSPPVPRRASTVGEPVKQVRWSVPAYCSGSHNPPYPGSIARTQHNYCLQ